jgi:hypothetical protein
MSAQHTWRTCLTVRLRNGPLSSMPANWNEQREPGTNPGRGAGIDADPGVDPDIDDLDDDLDESAVDAIDSDSDLIGVVVYDDDTDGPTVKEEVSSGTLAELAEIAVTGTHATPDINDGELMLEHALVAVGPAVSEPDDEVVVADAGDDDGDDHEDLSELRPRSAGEFVCASCFLISPAHRHHDGDLCSDCR